MTRRIIAAYRVELSKAMRMKSTYVGFLLVVIAVLCGPLVYGLHKDGESDYSFLLLIAPATLNLLGVILLLAYSAGLVSSELGAGTARLMLVRPVLRHEFLLAKLLLGMTYAVLLALLVSVMGWGMIILFGDLGGIHSGGEQLYTGNHVLGVYLMSLVLTLFPMFAAVSYAVMISTFTRSTAAAITASLGIWIVVDAAKYPLGIAPYSFTTYFEAPWDALREIVNHNMDPQWFPTAGYCMGVSAITVVVCFLVGALVFRRRNLAGC